jgi:hypothetical protein
MQGKSEIFVWRLPWRKKKEKEKTFAVDAVNTG